MRASQGPKRPPWYTDGRKKWNKGAPLSKKSKGVGRGANLNKKNKGDTMTTVPLPTTVAEVRDPGMATLFAAGGA